MVYKKMSSYSDNAPGIGDGETSLSFLCRRPGRRGCASSSSSLDTLGSSRGLGDGDPLSLINAWSVALANCSAGSDNFSLNGTSSLESESSSSSDSASSSR